MGYLVSVLRLMDRDPAIGDLVIQVNTAGQAVSLVTGKFFTYGDHAGTATSHPITNAKIDHSEPCRDQGHQAGIFIIIRLYGVFFALANNGKMMCFLILGHLEEIQ